MSDNEITFTYTVPTEDREMPDLDELISFAKKCYEEAGRRHAVEFLRAIGMEQVDDTVPIDPKIVREIQSMIHFEEPPVFHFKDNK